METGGVGASVAGSPGAIRAEVAELLGVSADTVDPDGNLVSQGLDSIRMMSLAGRWRRRGIAVDFATLAADPDDRGVVAAGFRGQADTSEPVDAEAAAAPAAPDDAFPLAPMQHAMWVGRHDNQPLGGVAGHLYVEFDGGAIDPDRLRAGGYQFGDAASDAAGAVSIRWNPADRSGRTERTGFPVTVHDLRDLAEDVVEQRLAGLREAKSHQQLDGQVLELTLSLLPGGRSRLHVDLDMQAADAMSYRTLMADLATLYQGRQLPELRYTLPGIPPARWRGGNPDRSPSVKPTATGGRSAFPNSRTRPVCRLRLENISRATAPGAGSGSTRRTRDALFTSARSRGVTPAMMFAAAFAHTLACWSSTSRFLLNVPLFGREALHPDVDSLVGDFTSSLLLDIDLTGTGTAASRAQACKTPCGPRQLTPNYPGLSVLRDLGRYRGTPVLAPVVFTSALGLGELFCADVTEAFGTPGWIISQGPQVSLDAQVTEFDGGVLVNWDVREDVFPLGCHRRDVCPPHRRTVATGLC